MNTVKKLHTATGPWLNFPNTDRNRSPEVVFTKRFINAYRKETLLNGVGIREFSVAGLGIADFLWIEKGKDAPKITAFELKLKNWKQGLSQAYRYSFFSDESYLVVPNDLAQSILKKINFFKETNIGLIGFCESRSQLIAYVVPEKKHYSSIKARSRALRNLITNYDLSFLAKYVDCLI